MEEIICPKCGRANLSEAVKCWYCQTKFEKKQEYQEDQQQSRAGYEKQAADTKATSNNPETAEEIPDWLSRVRELRKADEELEEQNDQWQQEALFSNKENASKLGEKKKLRKISRKKQSVKNSIPEPPLIKNAVKTEHTLDEKESHPDREPRKTETESNSLDELPKGFTPLSHKNEDGQTNP